MIVQLSKFKLLSGKEMLLTYTFNPGVAKHTFCIKMWGKTILYTSFKS
ncbi:hypothetical protein tinsulaeT_14570 [Thalassotalea insulae]|uniref:Uncharacterized protein n=1 Tax=Thalassotalea insulae TaxID=2056778 RepID=A0ABQ6GQB9_9GAMM|nr:hypothetical protein tinsulaeT_14570 [Thalassotalea insulae]